MVNGDCTCLEGYKTCVGGCKDPKSEFCPVCKIYFPTDIRVCNCCDYCGDPSCDQHCEDRKELESIVASGINSIPMKDYPSPVHSEPITKWELDSFIEIEEEPIGAEYLEPPIQQQEPKKIQSYKDYEALTPDELDERVKMAFINLIDRAADNHEMKRIGQRLLENAGAIVLDAYSTYDIDTGNINLHYKFGIDKELF